MQRRDWLWVLAEEILRSALWFHPAILWLTSRIQLAREELVDELTVLATAESQGLHPGASRVRRRWPRAPRARLRTPPSAVHPHRPPIKGECHVVFAHCHFSLRRDCGGARHRLACQSGVPDPLSGRGTHICPIRRRSDAPPPRQSPSSGQSNRQTWDAYVQGTQASLKVLSRRHRCPHRCPGSAQRWRAPSRSHAGSGASCRHEADHAGESDSAATVVRDGAVPVSIGWHRTRGYADPSRHPRRVRHDRRCAGGDCRSLRRRTRRSRACCRRLLFVGCGGGQAMALSVARRSADRLLRPRDVRRRT